MPVTPIVGDRHAFGTRVAGLICPARNDHDSQCYNSHGRNQSASIKRFHFEPRSPRTTRDKCPHEKLAQTLTRFCTKVNTFLNSHSTRDAHLSCASAAPRIHCLGTKDTL